MSVKKILASVLLVCMVLSLGSVAFAAETDCDHAGEFILSSTLKPATCESAGVGKYVCAKCGEYYEYRSIAAAHDWVETGKTEPECGVAATVSYECSICDATKTEDVPDTALKHVMEKTGKVRGCCAAGTLEEELVCANGCGKTTWKKVSKVTDCTWEEVGYAEPDCTHANGVQYKCTVCGAVKVEEFTLGDPVYEKPLGHKYEKVTITGNCKTGTTTYEICSVCGDKINEVTTATPDAHEYTEEILREATCEGGKLVAGLKKVTCTVCNTSSYESIKAAHSYGDVVVTKEATCTEKGATVQTCTVCGNEKKGTVKALGHSEDTIEIPATCVAEAGTVIGCKRCGDEATIDWTTWKVVGPALGHDYDYSKAVKVTVDCKAGKTTEEYKCTRCDAVDTVEIAHAAKGCTEGELIASNDDPKKVDCTTGLGEQYACLYCGEPMKWTEQQPTGHKYGKAVVTAGTCGTAGKSVQTCSKCGDEIVTAGKIDPENHEYSIANEENYTVLREATHTQTGIYYVTCLCGKTTEYVSVDKLAHEWALDTEEEGYVAPTCTKTGLGREKCTVCGEYKTTDFVVLPMIKHGTGTKTVDPTCTTKGAVYINVCEGCGYMDLKEEIPALGHDFVATGELVYDCEKGTVSEVTKCTVCGKTGSNKSSFDTEGHDWVDEVDNGKNATCERPKGKSAVCSVCGKIGVYDSKLKDYAIAAYELAEHAYAEDKEASVAPTCTTAGKTVEVCSVCGDVKETVVKAVKDAHVTEVVSTLRAATCTETGVNKVACTLCDFTGYEATPVVPHDMKIVEDDTYVAATCKKDGSATTKCAVCGATDVIVLSKDDVEHTWKYDYIAKEATCTKAGTAYAKYCTVCKAYEGKATIPATGHTEVFVKTVVDCVNEKTYDVYGCSVKGCEDVEIIKNEQEIETNGEHAYDNGTYFEATCEKGDYIEYVCERCGDKYEEAGYEKKTGHDTYTETIEGTCVEKGKILTICHNCGETISEKDTAKNKDNHSWIETVVREGTCDQPGIIKIECELCGESDIIYDGYSGHTWGTEEIFDEKLNIIYVECENCDAIDVIFSLHSLWEDWSVYVEPTCTDKGHEVDVYCSGACDICGAAEGDEARLIVKGEEIPALGHELGEWTTTVEPTCQTEGAKAAVCAICGETVIEKLAVVDHSWDEGEVTTPATCTETGVMTYSCIYGCGETKTEEIAVIAHAYDEGVVTTEPTCGAAGVLTKTCACGATITEEIAATGAHVYDEGVVTTEATCEDLGEKTYTCDCGATKTEEIPAKGHTYTARYSFKRDDNGNCILNEDGSYIIVKTSTCGTCGDVVTEIA